MRTLALIMVVVAGVAWFRIAAAGTRRWVTTAIATPAAFVLLLTYLPATAPTYEPDPQVVVPDVHGLPVDQAVAALESAGLRTSLIWECGARDETVESVVTVEQRTWWGVEEPIVTDQGVLPGAAELPPGARVSLRVSNGDPCS